MLLIQLCFMNLGPVFVVRTAALLRSLIMQLRIYAQCTRSGEATKVTRKRRESERAWVKQSIIAVMFPRGLIAAAGIINSRIFALVWHVAFF